MELGKKVQLEGKATEKVVRAMAAADLFKGLNDKQIKRIADAVELFHYPEMSTVVEEATPSDAFFIVLSGELAVLAHHDRRNELVELARLSAGDSFGELGLLLNQPRFATVRATKASILIRMRAPVFEALFEKIPEFGRSICRALAEKISLTNQNLMRTAAPLAETPADESLFDLLPLAFIQRYRVLPLSLEKNVLSLGCVDPPTPATVGAVRHFTRALEIHPVGLRPEDFDRVLRERVGIEEWQDRERHTPCEPAEPEGRSGADPRLDELLRRMLAEGASDLHLSGGHRPRWRVDGSIMELTDAAVLSEDAVLELIRDAMTPDHLTTFEQTNDCDFSLELPGEGRFRVNLFRDAGGIGAVLRAIPVKVLKMDQLGLPPVARRLLDNPRGMVLVTGPTGCGKSTTLAAMIDEINDKFDGHIITLEDPIEFVHRSKSCLINQREIGCHTEGFHKGLRAALREDPDIVLVGELRDLETVSLALETANTGHLVLATLHTTTAIGSIARIIDMFPQDQRAMVRAILADSLRGVISQTLCRKIGGGRVGVYEVLVVNPAVSNLIRESKTHQIESLMQTGKADGNQLLYEELAQLSTAGVITEKEAMAKTTNKKELTKRLAGLASRSLPS